jgi:hypothetical protein
MIDVAQKRALRNYRKRLAKQGVARFEGAGEPPKQDILAALRRSPLIEAGLNLARSRDTGRKVDL